ncbi:hypothetical protein PFISCL1PPCAC_4809, partial [Pristionchus fissidentatus]
TRYIFRHNPKDSRDAIFEEIQKIAKDFNHKVIQLYFAILELYRRGRSRYWIIVENLSNYEKEIIKQCFPRCLKNFYATDPYTH